MIQMTTLLGLNVKHMQETCMKTRPLKRSRNSWTWRQRPWVNSWQTIWDRRWLLGSIAGHNEYPRNYWGLGILRTVNALKRAWNREALICVFLMETKLSTEQLNNMKQNWDYNQGLVVSSNRLSSGLALLWKPNTQVHVQNFSRWFIHAHIVCADIGLKWRLTGFYGHPDTSKRKEM